MDTQEILTQLQTELKGFIDKAQAEQKANGTVLVETKDAIQAINKRIDEIEVRMAKPAVGDEHKSIADELGENESFQRVQRDGRGTAHISFKTLADLERKTTITSATVGSATSGVLNPMRVPGIVPAAEQRLTIRNILPVGQTSANAIDYVKENVFTNAASPQVEGSDKAESALTFTTGTAAVRTLAHWIPATRQVLADFGELAGYINRKLLYGLKLKEETELLSGDNTGVHLNGLITQATSFTTGLLVPASAGWNKADVIRRAIQQVESANETPVDFIVLNPVNWADMELTKSTTYEYVAGNPYKPLPPMLWGVPVVVTNAITSGTFLVGSSAQAQIWDRQGVELEISTEHSDYFIKNMVAIRIEERLTLAVYRTAAFVTGSLTTSPA